MTDHLTSNEQLMPTLDELNAYAYELCVVPPGEVVPIQMLQVFQRQLMAAWKVRSAEPPLTAETFYAAMDAAKRDAGPPNATPPSREQFEAWARSLIGSRLAHDLHFRTRDGSTYMHPTALVMWWAWSAARQSQIDIVEMSRRYFFDGLSPSERIRLEYELKKRLGETKPAIPCVWRDGCRAPEVCAAKGHCDAPTLQQNDAWEAGETSGPLASHRLPGGHLLINCPGCDECTGPEEA